MIMRRREFLAWCVAAATLATAGCATLADDPKRSQREARGSGVIVVYAASFDQVWSALPAVVKELELKVASDNKAEGILLADAGVSAFSWGERIAIYVERVGTRAAYASRLYPGAQSVPTSPPPTGHRRSTKNSASVSSAPSRPCPTG
jgi:hypothetical protein